MDRARNPPSEGKLKSSGGFVDVRPFRKVLRPVLEHNASVVIHDQADSCFQDVVSFSLPDHFVTSIFHVRRNPR